MRKGGGRGWGWGSVGVMGRREAWDIDPYTRDRSDRDLSQSWHETGLPQRTAPAHRHTGSVTFNLPWRPPDPLTAPAAHHTDRPLIIAWYIYFLLFSIFAVAHHALRCVISFCCCFVKETSDFQRIDWLLFFYTRNPTSPTKGIFN